MKKIEKKKHKQEKKSKDTDSNTKREGKSKKDGTCGICYQYSLEMKRKCRNEDND